MTEAVWFLQPDLFHGGALELTAYLFPVFVLLEHRAYKYVA